jgi:hypothetical protein
MPQVRALPGAPDCRKGKPRARGEGRNIVLRLRERSARSFHHPSIITAPVAQLDRVSASEAEGRGFDSRQAHQIVTKENRGTGDAISSFFRANEVRDRPSSVNLIEPLAHLDRASDFESGCRRFDSCRGAPKIYLFRVNISFFVASRRKDKYTVIRFSSSGTLNRTGR